MKKKRKAQIWDCIEVFGKTYNNHHMYCFIDLENHIREELLQAAVDKSFEVFPIIKSRYVEGFFRAYWLEGEEAGAPVRVQLVNLEKENRQKSDQEEGYRREDRKWEDQKNSRKQDSQVQEEREIQSFLQDEINETSYGQIRIKIIRRTSNDKICIALNHMVCDAADFKNYLYTLSSIYTELLHNKDYQPEFRCDGNRSGEEVYFKFIKSLDSQPAKRRALFQIQNHKAYHAKMSFPDQSMLFPFISTRVINRERFQAIRQYCDRNKVTVNDVFLTAFLRTVNQYLPDEAETLNVPCMVDLRRFLEEGELRALKNLTATLVVSIGNEMGATFDETIKKVHHQMKELLTEFTSLDGYLYLLLMFRMLPVQLVKKFIEKNFQSFPIAFSNLGIIDSDRLVFGDIQVRDCMMTGSIKQKPCFWFALSSFDKKTTLTINLNGSREDQRFVEKFLMELDNELPG